MEELGLELALIWNTRVAGNTANHFVTTSAPGSIFVHVNQAKRQTERVLTKWPQELGLGWDEARNSVWVS